MRNIFLFDIDGVLVEPHGYRTAVRETVKYFMLCLGLENVALPDEDDYAWLESQRITSEWDMVPLLLAAGLEYLMARGIIRKAPGNLREKIRPVHIAEPARPDYTAILEPLTVQLRPGEYPSDTAVRIIRSFYKPELVAGRQSATGLDRSSPPFLPHLAGLPLLEEMLANTRDIQKSATTRLFQNLALGGRVFKETYGLEAELDSPPLLQMEDRPLLTSHWRDELIRRWKAGEIGLAAYTMRPSLPPRNSGEGNHGYSPEAELALSLVGMEAIPLIGYGRILYLALRYGEMAESYLKPSPVQALAAIFAALTGQELPALEAARRIYRQDFTAARSWLPQNLQLFSSNTQPVQVHIFEDSPGGIEAVQRAGELLRQVGIQVRVQPWGIANNPDKVNAIQELKAPVYSSIGEILAELV